jgi:murein DD-endopeptidase MepM/ murein hydrolase activator NlpD
LSIASIPLLIFVVINLKLPGGNIESSLEDTALRQDKTSLITGVVQQLDTMDAIFDKHALNKVDLSEIIKSSKSTYNLSKLSVGNVYSFDINKKENTVQDIQYEIDDYSYLKVTRTPEGFKAERVKVEYTKKIGSLFINIKDNLIFSLPNTSREYLKLAFKLSDIFAWDIDFSSDIRNNDSIKIIVEELWIGNVFKGFGNILTAEFFNNGTLHKAYRFEYDGYADYFNDKGKSLRKTLLKSPLRFKYISSGFSRRRLHPILRIVRPHLGVDYAAPTGTPVSAAGDGTVMYAGYKGQNGKMVRIRHNSGLETFYGHLSRIPKRIRKWVKISQGDIIGYVGTTGLSTGPHLDYRIKRNGMFVNPLTVKLPRGKSIPKHLIAEFRQLVEYMDVKLASLTRPFIAFSVKEKVSS